MKKRVLVTALSLAVASMFLVACGNDDEGSATPPADDVATGADTSAEESGPADEGDSADSDAADAGSGDVEAMDISSLGDFECLKIGNALTTVVGRGVIGDFDADLATFKSFAAGAPADTHADFDTFLDAYESSYRMLEDAGISLNAASSMESDYDTVTAATDLIETPEVEAALATAEETFFEACPTMRPEG